MVMITVAILSGWIASCPTTGEIGLPPAIGKRPIVSARSWRVRHSLQLIWISSRPKSAYCMRCATARGSHAALLGYSSSKADHDHRVNQGVIGGGRSRFSTATDTPSGASRAGREGRGFGTRHPLPAASHWAARTKGRADHGDVGGFRCGNMVIYETLADQREAIENAAASPPEAAVGSLLLPHQQIEIFHTVLPAENRSLCLSGRHDNRQHIPSLLHTRRAGAQTAANLGMNAPRRRIRQRQRRLVIMVMFGRSG
jgi:hypothetical protein